MIPKESSANTVGFAVRTSSLSAISDIVAHGVAIVLGGSDNINSTTNGEWNEGRSWESSFKRNFARSTILIKVLAIVSLNDNELALVLNIDVGKTTTYGLTCSVTVNICKSRGIVFKRRL